MTLDLIEMLKIVSPIVGALIALLLAGNLFFVRRLVKTIDSVSENFPTYQQKVEAMAEQINDLKGDVQRISSEFKDVSALKERIAVLEFAYKEMKGKSP